LVGRASVRENLYESTGSGLRPVPKSTAGVRWQPLA